MTFSALPIGCYGVLRGCYVVTRVFWVDAVRLLWRYAVFILSIIKYSPLKSQIFWVVARVFRELLCSY